MGDNPNIMFYPKPLGCLFLLGYLVKSSLATCYVEFPQYIGDGFCDEYNGYNTPECAYDGGDCAELNNFKAKYPDCEVEYPDDINDGICTPGYNTEECGYDNGECGFFNLFYMRFHPRYPDCNVENPEYLGDGYCD